MKKLLNVVAGILLTVTALASHAVPATLTPGSWENFSFGSLGPIVDPAEGYTLTVTGPTLLRVVDCCVIGDEFRVTLDDGSGPIFFDTSDATVGFGSSSGTSFDGDSEWAHALLSKGSILIGAGTWDIDIELTVGCCGSGAGFIRADAAVPAPATLLLAALGLAAAGTARRRTGKTA